MKFLTLVLVVQPNISLPNITSGEVILSGGTYTVSTSFVHTASKIFYGLKNPSNPGFLYTSTIVDGVSFTIQSSNVLDASTVDFLIVD